MVFPQGGDVVRHPSQLYEAGLEGLLMAAILWPLFWRTGVRYMPGFLFGLAAMIYGFSRFIVEFFREPDAHLVWVVQETGLSMGNG
jgi:phosphatidylglycerol:prolipoprotein diacylglycerol transferase